MNVATGLACESGTLFRRLLQPDIDHDDWADVGADGKALGFQASFFDDDLSQDDADEPPQELNEAPGQPHEPLEVWLVDTKRLHKKDDFDQPPQEWTEAQWQPQGPTEEQWPPQCEAPPQCELPPQREAPPRRSPHDVWILEGRRLRGKDRTLTHNFTQTLRGEVVKFVVMLRPKVKSEGRGAGNFVASKGRGYIDIKCTLQIDMLLALFVEVGLGGHRVCVLHNFAKDAVCKVPADWNFWEESDADTCSLSIGFHAEPHGFPQKTIGEASGSTSFAPKSVHDGEELSQALDSTDTPSARESDYHDEEESQDDYFDYPAQERNETPWQSQGPPVQQQGPPQLEAPPKYEAPPQFEATSQRLWHNFGDQDDYFDYPPQERNETPWQSQGPPVQQGPPQLEGPPKYEAPPQFEATAQRPWHNFGDQDHGLFLPPPLHSLGLCGVQAAVPAGGFVAAPALCAGPIFVAYVVPCTTMLAPVMMINASPVVAAVQPTPVPVCGPAAFKGAAGFAAAAPIGVTFPAGVQYQ